MLWGGGTADATDAMRLAQFQHMALAVVGSSGSSKVPAPRYVLGYEEPDCAVGAGSAGMSVVAGVGKWEALMAPLGARGAKLGSPAMCSEWGSSYLFFFGVGVFGVMLMVVVVVVGRTGG